MSFRAHLKFVDDDIETITSFDQKDTENRVAELLSQAFSDPEKINRSLQRDNHISYLRHNLLKTIATAYQTLDASKPWLVYWIVQALYLLGGRLESEEVDRVVNYLGRCQCQEGGFAGGPQQFSHLAPTYASVHTLVILGSQRGFDMINRPGLYNFLMSMRKPDGSFVMHKDGEQDIRGCYCALSVARTCNILTPELSQGTAEWIKRCQTYEGGLGGVPGDEAHGGYTFCGLAAMYILQKTDMLNIPRLLHWSAHRQMRLEGGFQGRTNKLVDSCYSYWMGGTFAILSSILDSEEKAEEDVSFDVELNDDGSIVIEEQEPKDLCFYDRSLLQQYIIHCCETNAGGFKDKPGKNRDFYHTCYALSGLSIAQHVISLAPDRAATETGSTFIHGSDLNKLILTDPVHNVSADRLADALAYFATL